MVANGPRRGCGTESDKNTPEALLTLTAASRMAQLYHLETFVEVPIRRRREETTDKGRRLVLSAKKEEQNG